MKPARHSWQLIALATALAILVWFTIQRATQSELGPVYNVRVVPQLPQGWRVTDVQPPTVDLTIRGERSDVIATTADHFQVRPFLAPRPSLRRMEVELDVADVKGPPKIRVTYVEPSRVRVTLEPFPDALEQE